ncbi:DUF3617 domain-containing protein [Sphingomonas sp. GCM10030256]|uniref:DUF3617 domain-containing protein n=1 Tax=Sphingomonas sp. GCM10030256 TaxID=3273427 RepID=UPI003617801F
MRAVVTVAALMSLAACSSEAPPPPPAASPAKLAAGQWEVTAKVAELTSTDKTVPAVQAKVGDTATASACVEADGVLPAELFAVAGQQCAARNPYVRNGRMNLQLDCTAGQGKVVGEINGKFTADSLTASVTSTSFFTGSGDYRLKRELTGRRIGECSPKVAER